MWQHFHLGNVMRSWLERKDTTLRQEREKKIYDLWLACWTQEEIAETVGLSQQEISKITESRQTAELPKGVILEASHADLDQLPIYNVWKQKQYTSEGDCTLFAVELGWCRTRTQGRFLRDANRP